MCVARAVQSRQRRRASSVERRERRPNRIVYCSFQHYHSSTLEREDQMQKVKEKEGGGAKAPKTHHATDTALQAARAREHTAAARRALPLNYRTRGKRSSSPARAKGRGEGKKRRHAHKNEATGAKQYKSVYKKKERKNAACPLLWWWRVGWNGWGQHAVSGRPHAPTCKMGFRGRGWGCASGQHCAVRATRLLCTVLARERKV